MSGRILIAGALLAIVAGLLLMAAPSEARADMLAEINAARVAGCDGHAGTRQSLRSSEKLDEIARRVQGGANLHDAMSALRYVAIKSSSVQMQGWLTDAAVARNLAKRFCALLIDPQLREIGISEKNRGVWIVLAQPLSAPAPKDWASVSRRVLELTNEARRRARNCGREHFEAAGPLTLSAALNQTALEHSRDMARRNYFEHEGRDGSQPGDRVSRQGYKWRVVGENLAAGVATADEAVQGWIDSPHHCTNLMEPRFTQMGVAFAVDPTSSMAIYWTQVFALPQR